MQLIVQNVDLLEFSKWTMAVYDEQEEKLSSIFFLSKPVYDRLGNLYLHVSSENGDNVVDDQEVNENQKVEGQAKEEIIAEINAKSNQTNAGNTETESGTADPLPVLRNRQPYDSG